MHFLILQGAKVVFNGFNGELTKREVPGHHMALKVGHLYKRETVSTDRKLIFIGCSVLSFMIRGKWWGQLVARTFMLWEKENIQLWLGYQALFDPKYILKIIQKWIIAKSKNLRIFIAANFQSWHFWSLHFDGIFKESLLWSAKAKDKRSLLPILLLLLCRRLLLTWRSNHLLLF